MPLFQVTFMNHIVETYLVEADDEEAAWETPAEDVEDIEPERWDCTSCEIIDVQPVDAPSIAEYRLQQQAGHLAGTQWHLGPEEEA